MTTRVPTPEPTEPNPKPTERSKKRPLRGRRTPKTPKTPKTKTPKTVPVTNRDRKTTNLNDTPKPKRKPNFLQQDLASTGILIAVILTVLVAIAVPLRNYYEGRAEIARATASIEALEAQKEALEKDISLYDDPSYALQEARRRLGVLAEGEQAWRIIDPRMTQGPAITTEEVPDTRPWHTFLWDSLRELPDTLAPEASEVPAPPAEAPAPAPAP